MEVVAFEPLPGAFIGNGHSAVALYTHNDYIYGCLWRHLSQERSISRLLLESGRQLYLGDTSRDWHLIDTHEKFEDHGSFVMVAASKFQLGRWLLNDDNVSFVECMTDKPISYICTSQEHVCGVEGKYLVMRNQSLEPLDEISIDISHESATRLAFMGEDVVVAAVNSTLHIWHYTNKQLVIYPMKSQEPITSLCCLGDIMLVGGASGRVAQLRVVLSPELTMIAMHEFDIARERRFTVDRASAVITHDEEPLAIGFPHSDALVVLTPSSYFILHPASLRLRTSGKLSATIPEANLPLRTAYLLIRDEAGSYFDVVYAPAFKSALYCHRVKYTIEADPVDALTEPMLALSFFASSDVIQESTILNTKASPPPTPNKLKGALRAKVPGEWEAPLKVKGKLVDQPVTFHTRIKSSGYGKQELDYFAKKKLEREKKLKATIKRSASVSALDGKPSGPRFRSYDVACNPMTQYQRGNELTAIPVPYYKICFNADGSMLGAATAQSSVATLRLPVHKYKGEGVHYVGHDSRVTSICFSNDKALTLSSSADASVRIWKDRSDAPAILLTHYLHQPAGIDPSLPLTTTLKTSTTRNKPFAAPIRHSCFFFLDKLIMVAVKNSLLLYSYELEERSKNDIKRQQTLGKYTQVYHCLHEGAQNITAATCMNTVQSPLVITSASDKKLYIIDTSAGKVARVVESPHEKSIHCIALPSPSVYTQLPSDAYNIFVTSAIDNNVMIWDIRSCSSVARYSGHVNRREEVGCALSPCMRYLATGSEDRSARIVDLRMCKELAKLPGHRDVCSDVAFNPLFSQLVTCSYDGALRFYCDPTVNDAQYEFM